MEEKTKCGTCHTAHKNKDLIEFDGVLLCRSCYEVEVTHCTYCGEAIWRNDNSGDRNTPFFHCGFYVYPLWI